MDSGENQQQSEGTPDATWLQQVSFVRPILKKNECRENRYDDSNPDLENNIFDVLYILPC
jgi:hypothetical protein